ncbi:MAG: dihydrodipicolinate reductase [Dehalococcoidia bacterium]
MSSRIRAVLVGCGSIGSGVGRLALQRPDLELVGAVDTDAAKIGRDLGKVLGLDRNTGIIVSESLDAVLSKANADVAFHHVGGPVQAIAPQLIRLAKLGVNVVSSNEALAYPFRKHPELSAQIDDAARAGGVTILSTGANPGFVMDTWPLVMTAVCQLVRRVRVARVQDAGARRLEFQKKIGAGLTPEEFQASAEAGKIRHSGMAESIAMVAAGLGWELDDIIERVEPVIAKERVQGQHLTVERGQTAGLRHVGRGITDGDEVIIMEFQASLGAGESYDAVYLTGTPDMEVVVKGGIHGDVGTSAMVVNSALRVLDGPPGLLTMKDIPLVTCRDR